MTFTKWIIAAVAVALVWPAWLAAQETPKNETPKPTPRPHDSRQEHEWAFSWNDNRGRIGVVVRMEADVESDKLGAKLEAVTPGGPAEQAGLKAGDVITKFNGTSLGGVLAEDEDDSGPGRKLTRLARKLEPGDTVRIEYRRGGETKAATLVAKDIAVADGRRWSVVVPRIPPERIPRIVEPGLRGFAFGFGGGWGDLDLVTLNPELGEYFGTREGILVVKVPGDSGLPLRGGDVILSIGRRKPSSPSHAMRILQSYEPGETVSIEVMRKQNRTTLAWKVPEAEDRRIERVRVRPRQGSSGTRL